MLNTVNIKTNCCISKLTGTLICYTLPVLTGAIYTILTIVGIMGYQETNWFGHFPGFAFTVSTKCGITRCINIVGTRI